MSNKRKRPESHACVRDRFADCICAKCEPLLAAEFEVAWKIGLERAELDAMLVAGAIDSVLSLVPERMERRRVAVLALLVLRGRGFAPQIVDGALRVPMEALPVAIREWLADPNHRAAVEELLDEERTGQRHEAA